MSALADVHRNITNNKFLIKNFSSVASWMLYAFFMLSLHDLFGLELEDL